MLYAKEGIHVSGCTAKFKVVDYTSNDGSPFKGNF